MTAERVVISAAAIVAIFAVTGIYYFVLPRPGDSTTVTIVATGSPPQGSLGAPEQGLVFAPANFTVRDGQRVTLVFVNRGSAPHELVIPQMGVDTGVVNVGATKSVSFVAGTVGTFFDMQPCGTSAAKLAGLPGCNIAGYGNIAGYVTVSPP
ncbi:MAG TPA: cupredoxin domain-containing protein [Nitrososphaerales archaeon]|nr:cupredoxin domain-containing protein [Nitrososphaerales archaeon]